MKIYNKLHFIVSLFLLVGSGQVFAQSNVETVIQKGHSRYVSSVAYSPDGKYVATGSFDSTIKLWNVASGKEIRTLAQQTGGILFLYFSSDGKYLLSTSNDNMAVVYNVSTGNAISTIQHAEDKIRKACFSPDDTKIMTVDEFNNLYVWDALTGEAITYHKRGSRAMCNPQWFSADGNIVPKYMGKDEVNLVSLAGSTSEVSCKIENAFSYAFHPLKEQIAISSGKKYIKVFDTNTGNELFKMDPNEAQPCNGCQIRIAYSPDGKYLASCDKYSDLVIWNAGNGSKLMQFDIQNDWVSGIYFSPDNKHIVVVSDDESRIFSLNDNKEVLFLKTEGIDCQPAFSAKGNKVLATNDDNTAAIWSIATGKKERELEGYLRYKPSDKLGLDDGNWSQTHLISYLANKSRASLHPSGKYIVKGQVGSDAIMLNIQTGKIEKRFKGHEKSVICTAISHNGKYLATGSGDHSVKLWDIESGKEIRTLKGHGALVFDVKFSSDDKYLVSGSWDATASMWEVESGKPLRYYKNDNSGHYTVGFTPHDLYVISSTLGYKLVLFETDGGEVFRSMVGHSRVISDFSFSSSGKEMVTSSIDGYVKVWDLLSGMLINKHSLHKSGVTSVVFDPQNRFVISGGKDRDIVLWDPQSNKEVGRLKGHSGAVTSLEVSKDGNRLVSCSVDGEIKVWNLDDQKELYTYIQIDEENWLAKNPQGYFDGSPKALKQINYVSGLEVIPVSSLFEKYYSPNLIKRIVEGEEFTSELLNLENLVKESPDVTIDLPSDNTEFSDSLQWFASNITLSFETMDNGGGVDELRIYNNGKLIENVKYDGTKKRSGKAYKENIEIPLLTGENNITAVAFNHDRTESEPVEVKVFYDGIESEVDLYIMTVGVNEYQNPSYNLSYAVNDAKAYSKSVKKNAKAMFASVEEYFITDDEVNKKKITEVFNEIKSKAGAEDVFIFYYAGHGAMSVSGENDDQDFFIIPHDVTQLYGNDEMLVEKAISAKDLMEVSKNIQARKQMYILDACQSGGALNAFNQRGAGREKAIAQLARSTGTYFLLASGAVQFANEAKDLEHGLFTYALLEGLEGKADGGVVDGKITANELRGYVEDRVPELTEKYMLTPQYPTGYSFGQDFPIILVK